jgi:hypothetical protein
MWRRKKSINLLLMIALHTSKFPAVGQDLRMLSNVPHTRKYLLKHILGELRQLRGPPLAFELIGFFGFFWHLISSRMQVT